MADYNPDINDSIAIVENLATVLDIRRGVLWVDRPLILSIDLSDSISIAEVLPIAGVLAIDISDSITITEALTLLLTILSIDVADTLTIAESFTPSKGLTSEGYSDSIAITEKVIAAIVVGSGRNPLPVQRQQVR